MARPRVGALNKTAPLGPRARQWAGRGSGASTIDGKLQLQVLGSAAGELTKDGINGAVRRGFSAKAGETLLNSVCVYQPLVAGRPVREAKLEGKTLRLDGWNWEWNE